MALFALRRFLLAIPLLVGITFVSFLVIHLAPGEPTEVQTGDLSVHSTAQARQAPRELYGLDKPLHLQYLKWLTRVAQLDFGRSFQPDGRPVLAKIGERLPITLLLNVVEMFLILACAVPIGVLSATRQYSLFDKVTTVFVFVGFATPDFWLAPLLRAALAQLGVPGLLAAAVGLPEPSRPAGGGGDLRRTRRLLALHAPEHAGGRPPGLHPDSAGQGAPRAGRHRQARPPQRAAAGGDDPGSLAAGAHRRQRDRRVHLRHPRHGPAHGPGRVLPGLPPHHGEPRHRRRAHPGGEPPGRPGLRCRGPAHPHGRPPEEAVRVPS